MVTNRELIVIISSDNFRKLQVFSRLTSILNLHPEDTSPITFKCLEINEKNMFIILKFMSLKSVFYTFSQHMEKSQSKKYPESQ